MNYNDNNPMSYSAQDAAVGYDEGLRSYMLGVYNYMASALTLTGIFAYLASHWAPLVTALYQLDGANPGLTGFGWLVMIAPLGFVLALSFGINRMSLPVVQGTFWAYSAVMGLSLSSIFFVYTGQSIVRVFLITAIVFGSMSIWGYTTKRDLTSMGNFLIMGVWGIFIASIVNIFLQSSGLQFAISVIAVVAFTGLTAYDTQKIKAVYYQVAGNAEAAGKFAVMGALNLYLDFINLFIHLLRFVGERRS